YAPAMKKAVLGIAGRNADEATYGALIKLGMSSTNPIEMQSYFTSAFSAKDPALAQRSLQMALNLPPQFASYAPGIVGGVGQDHPHVAWEFFKANKTKLLSSLPTFEQTNSITGIAQAFWNGVPQRELEGYMQANVPPEGAQLIAKATEGIKLRYQSRERMIPQIDAYLAASRGTAPR
ncbi:MAG: ERAP1-like C-terminal domain-containing protein, partial [Candidatus Eremiobacteraeota bacterium]|nr:ERAP1-like C-terminal domain-containing protein [Candidatus Eremiobacteraeota bacterium]